MLGDEDDLVDDTPEEIEPPEDSSDEGKDDPPEGDSSDDGEPDPEPKRGAKAELPSQKKKDGKMETPPPAPVQRPNHVPLATFLEEKRKFSEALDAERSERKKIQDQLDKLLNPPKAPPKFAEDPEGFIAHATKQSAQEVLTKLDEHGKRVNEVADATKQTAEQKAEQKFMEDLTAGGEVFAQANPDYGHALNHVRRIAFQQLRVWHPDATDEQIVDAISKQEIAMAKQAVAQGRNPHETAYRLALANGYKKAETPDPKKKVTNKINGKRVAAPVEDEDDDDTLDPSETLGRSNGESMDDDADDDIPDPDKDDMFDTAFREVFRPQKKRRAVF
jgi:hypothetical protein